MTDTSKAWRYVGRRHFYPSSMSQAGMHVHAITVPHPKGPWEAVFADTEELVQQAVTVVNEYDALKAVEAAARAAFVVLNATMTHRPSAERLHAAFAALDAIRKTEVAR